MSKKKEHKEQDFQTGVKEKIAEMFPGCIVTKVTAFQGIPDLLILWNKRWAMLECKRNEKAQHQPNQDHYVELMNKMSFSSFIYPENEEEVLDGLLKAFKPSRKARNVSSK